MHNIYTKTHSAMLCARRPAVVVKPLPNGPAQRLVPDARGRQKRARHRRIHMPRQRDGASVRGDEGVETLALLVTRVRLADHADATLSSHHLAVLADATHSALDLHLRCVCVCVSCVCVQRGMCF